MVAAHLDGSGAGRPSSGGETRSQDIGALGGEGKGGVSQSFAASMGEVVEEEPARQGNLREPAQIPEVARQTLTFHFAAGCADDACARRAAFHDKTKRPAWRKLQPTPSR